VFVPRSDSRGFFYELRRCKRVKIYVGNLSYSSSEEDIRAAFSQFGTVDSADVIIDRNTGRSKGFGFVEMSDENEAKAAIAGLNGKDLDGRSLNVNEARPRAERPQRSTYRY
jgi:RNA recognition motif-containing protein